MNLLKNIIRLEVLFLLAGLLLLIPCLFAGNIATDFTIHDTYFVVEHWHIGLLMLSLHTFYALIYFLIRRNQNYLLGLIHLVFGTPLFVYILLSSFFMMGGSERRYYGNNDPSIFIKGSLPEDMSLVMILFLLAQLCFLINVILSVVKRIKQKNKKI